MPATEPELLAKSASRRRRIARGSGRTEADVSALIGTFSGMRARMTELTKLMRMGGNAGLLLLFIFIFLKLYILAGGPCFAREFVSRQVITKSEMLNLFLPACIYSIVPTLLARLHVYTYVYQCYVFIYRFSILVKQTEGVIFWEDFVKRAFDKARQSEAQEHEVR